MQVLFASLMETRTEKSEKRFALSNSEALELMSSLTFSREMHNVRNVHKKRPPLKYNGVVFEILGKHH